MRDDAISTLVSGLAERTGAGRLLQAAGFTGPPRAVVIPGQPRLLRAVHTVRDGVLAAYDVVIHPPLATPLLAEVARALRTHDPVAHHFIIVAGRRRDRVALALSVPGQPLRHALLEPGAVRTGDIELLHELIAASATSGSDRALRMLHALDRSRVTERFFRDIVAVRDLVARAWTGVPRAAREQREALALLLLARLMFLYFLQRRGILDDDERFLPRRFNAWRAGNHAGTFYRTELRTLFFGVLNRRPAERTRRALALGRLPYLNGGLFELHRAETAFRAIDLPDDIMQRVFADLLEKYRFTSSDAAEQHAASSCGADVDPEMLGRIFEGLMSGDARGRTGTFYTPAHLVDRVVCTALAQHLARRCGIDERTAAALVHDSMDAAHSLPGAARGNDTGPSPGDVDRARAAAATMAATMRVLDPACGSGAFLLGVLARLGRLRAHGPDNTLLRREIVAHTLHGVDILEDAALICSLRLWLALLPTRGAGVAPLPNLDRRIRQGDALVDPLDIGTASNGRARDATTPPGLRPLLRALLPAAAAYLGAEPADRPALRRELQQLECALASAWIAHLETRMDRNARELAARAADTNLFGEPAAHAAAARRALDGALRRRAELAALRRQLGADRLPFFSFRVHFPEAADGFDLIVSNPPWVRAHRWPAAARTLLRERYRVCQRAGWPDAPGPTGTGGQVDLSLLFLERALGLLNQHGTLALLLPAKLLRSLYAGGARELLLDHAHLTTIEDHSLDHRSTFDADAFTSVIIAHAPGPDTPADAAVTVSMRHAGGKTLHFDVAARELPLDPGDTRAPWLLAPPPVRDALRTMQRAGARMAGVCEIRRGVMTGANEVIVARDVEPMLGDLARVRTEGYFRAATRQGRNAYTGWVEGSALRPALRGTDIAAWRTRVQRHLLWTPHNDEPRATPLPRLHRFLCRHRGRLGGDDATLGRVQRLSPATLGHKVVWSDLATELRAAAVPATVRSAMGTHVPVVPLNSVYFIATDDDDHSLLLAAYLNALPVRVFAKTVAERAKDAHFRFFAWTAGTLPLPDGWRTGRTAQRLIALSRAAHRRGTCLPQESDEMDRLIAAAYGLVPDQIDALARFDTWLRTGTWNAGEQDARAAG
jgi:hypothetical protein